MTRIAIVGAGLTGLSLAHTLIDAGHEVTLIEGRDRPGGRIASTNGLDLGPAWFWPGQMRMQRLVSQLGLTVFEQYATGDMVAELRNGQVQRGRGMASMAGSYRVAGGLGQITNALAQKLPPDCISYGTHVTGIDQSVNDVTVKTENGESHAAEKVILAMPPRLCARMSFNPDLPQDTINTLTIIPTWMAGHAKAIVTYEQPFWRQNGLSGDAMSQRGPMVEIHDASGADGAPYALFGFIGVPPAGRQDSAALETAIMAQLQRLFGPQAGNPTAVHIKDWAFDTLTATAADHAPLTHHPAYHRPPALGPHWNGTLQFASSELGSDAGGFLEGALACAEDISQEFS